MESLKSEAPFWKKESTDKGFRWVQPSNNSDTEPQDTQNEIQ
jgi:molybdopterin synthase catalytic subunit